MNKREYQLQDYLNDRARLEAAPDGKAVSVSDEFITAEKTGRFSSHIGPQRAAPKSMAAIEAEAMQAKAELNAIPYYYTSKVAKVKETLAYRDGYYDGERVAFKQGVGLGILGTLGFIGLATALYFGC